MTRYCPACGGYPESWADGPGGRPNARCPICQALERHRFLSFLLRSWEPLIRNSTHVLDIAPQRQVRRVLHEATGWAHYVGMDYLEPDRHIDLLGDMTRMPFVDSSFDVVLCYHVLEHIPDDKAAMREMARVLTPSGIAIVQVPRRAGVATDEDPAAPPEERIRRFGQVDHVRYYGNDFEARLRESGLDVTVIHPRDILPPDMLEAIAANPTEPVWVCRPTGIPSRTAERNSMEAKAG